MDTVDSGHWTQWIVDGQKRPEQGGGLSATELRSATSCQLGAGAQHEQEGCHIGS